MWYLQNVDQWRQDQRPAWSVPLARCGDLHRCLSIFVSQTTWNTSVSWNQEDKIGSHTHVSPHHPMLVFIHTTTTMDTYVPAQTPDTSMTAVLGTSISKRLSVVSTELVRVYASAGSQASSDQQQARKFTTILLSVSMPACLRCVLVLDGRGQTVGYTFVMPKLQRVSWSVLPSAIEDSQGACLVLCGQTFTCVPVEIQVIARRLFEFPWWLCRTSTDDGRLNRNVESSEFSSLSTCLLSSFPKRSPSSDTTPRKCSSANEYTIPIKPALRLWGSIRTADSQNR